MSITVVNEKLSKTQAKYVERYEAAATTLVEDPEFLDVSIEFGDKGKTITLIEDGDEKELSADAFIALVKEMEKQAKAKGAEAEKEAKKAEAEAAKAEKEKAKQAEEAKLAAERQKIIKAERGKLEKVVSDLSKDIKKEDKGELDKNIARYLKGMHLDAAEEIGQKLKEAQDEAFQGRGSTVIRFAKDEVARAFDSLGGVLAVRLRGKAIKALSNAEVSMTRKVYATYLKHEGGVDATFRLVDQRDPATGEPLVGDDGNPLEVPVTEIALNKLYALSDYYSPEVRDELLAFAHRNTERAVGAAAKLMTPENVKDIIAELNALTQQADENEADGEDSLTPQEAILDHVAEQQGQRKPSTVKNIAVDAAFYGGDWYETKRVATQIAKACDVALDDKGELGNTKLLETMIGEYFAPRRFGANNLVQLFVEAGDMTTKQAEKFLAEYEQGTKDGDDDGDAGEDTDDDGE